MKIETVRAMGARYPQVAPMLDITFKKDCIATLRLFWGQGRANGKVSFENEALVAAIVISGDWEHDSNRVVRARFPLGLMWHDDIFLSRVIRDIESIRFATQHPLNVLMMGRKKIQEENAARIIGECYGNLNYDKTFKDLQMQVMGDLEIVNGLPQLTFTLENVGGYKSTIVLDGWSGQMIINGIPQQKAYGGNPKEFHDIIWGLVFEYMDKITAPAK